MQVHKRFRAALGPISICQPRGDGRNELRPTGVIIWMMIDVIDCAVSIVIVALAAFLLGFFQMPAIRMC